MPSANLKISKCLFFWIIYFGGRNKQDPCPHPTLGRISLFPPAGHQSQSLVTYSCSLSGVIFSPSDDLAPGGVTNAAFVCRCSSHRAANIKQDRCLHHKTNQWPQGDLVASPPPPLFLISSHAGPHQAPCTAPGGQLAEQYQRAFSWMLIL